MPLLLTLTGACLRILPTALISFVFLLCAGGGARAEIPADMPAGVYKLDNRHTSITFKISHFGFSHFNGLFDKMDGDFTLHGVTHRMILDAVLVGAGKEIFLGTHVIGFSASGSFDRSDYGIRNLQPMIGDKVTLQIESEFDKE